MTEENKEKFTREYRTCPKHGEYLYSLENKSGEKFFTSGCNKCKAEQKIKDLFSQSAIPLRFQNKTFENYEAKTTDQKNALETVQTYAQQIAENPHSGQCLILVGNPGTGKTHLACAAAKYLIDKEITALFTSSSKIIQKVRASWNDRSISEEEVYKKFCQVDLLIIDEVGVQSGTENERNILFYIINERYENNLPMILISNLETTELETFIGTRAYDRLRECSYAVNFEWNSYR